MAFLVLHPLFLFPFFFFLFLFFYLTQLKPASNLPPGPRPWPVVGNLLQLGEQPHASLAEMARVHGPLISLKLGTQLLIIGSSPSTAAQILKTHDLSLSARNIPQTYRVKNYIPYSLAFSFDCNGRWKSLRTVCKIELFTKRMLDLQAHVREKKVGEMMESLFARRGEVVNLGELVFGTVFNIMGNVVFSRDVFSLEDEKDGPSDLKHQISRILELGLAPNLADFYPLLGGLDVQGLNGEATAFAERIYAIWEEFLREKREKESGFEKKLDFVDVLLSSGYSDLQLKALCTDMFVAGTDTLATLVDWTMSELMRNPKEMQKVRNELEQVVGVRKAGDCYVRESHLNGLSYLQACIKESLRLHPPVPLLLPREALNKCEVMDFTIPKGSRVMVNVWAIGRDPTTWNDPMKFSPERFCSSNIEYKGKNFEFTPFGAGRRMCPGVPLADRTAKLILASLIHTFSWSLPNGMQPNELSMDEKFGLTLERKQPLLLIPE